MESLVIALAAFAISVIAGMVLVLIWRVVTQVRGKQELQIMSAIMVTEGERLTEQVPLDTVEDRAMSDEGVIRVDSVSFGEMLADVRNLVQSQQAMVKQADEHQRENRQEFRAVRAEIKAMEGLWRDELKNYVPKEQFETVKKSYDTQLSHHNTFYWAIITIFVVGIIAGAVAGLVNYFSK